MAAHSESSRTGGRVLITGLQGFTGRHLAENLSRKGFDVHGTTALSSAEGSKCTVHRVDLLDADGMRTLLDQLKPAYVVHLAAVAFVAHGDIEQIYRTNIVGTRNVLTAADATAPGTIRRIVLASSANVYGNTVADPIAEDILPRPANDYAVSKLAMEHLAHIWEDRLPITVVRPFNYTGVGQSISFLVPKIVNAFLERASVIELGNVDVERDFSDVRDVVEIYARLLESPETSGTLNVCSGVARSLRDIIDTAQRITGHDLVIRQNPAFVRSNEVKRLRGSNAKLLSILGDFRWRSFEATLAWMLAR